MYYIIGRMHKPSPRRRCRILICQRQARADTEIKSNEPSSPLKYNTHLLAQFPCQLLLIEGPGAPAQGSERCIKWDKRRIAYGPAAKKKPTCCTSTVPHHGVSRGLRKQRISIVVHRRPRGGPPAVHKAVAKHRVHGAKAKGDLSRGGEGWA